ncbi:LURP-one-related/scramblase family protein [Vagococcus carniphilus]
MRQLFMKRKVSNPSETFTVTNRNEKDVYGVSVNSVENSQLITIHKSENQQVAMVTKEQSNDGSTFIVEVDNKKVFIIEKGLVQGTSKYIATSDELTIDGDLFGMSFNVMLGYRKVAKVRKRWTTLGNSYELTIFEDENEVALVGLVSTLDFIKSNED